jgi:SAM-dependent methyltransferase
MALLNQTINSFRSHSRSKRAKLFNRLFPTITSETRILDLGAADGSYLATVLSGRTFRAENVYISDIDSTKIYKGQEEFGFVPVVLQESGSLPFEDGYFDIVHCSSVIEHVTLPKSDVWQPLHEEEFRKISFNRQTQFADEIRRIGKCYFVQTPNRGFPVEAHTWLPFVGYFPHQILVKIIPYVNRYWIKSTKPDWCLLNNQELSHLFPDGVIYSEKFLGLTKSIIAVRTSK